MKITFELIKQQLDLNPVCEDGNCSRCKFQNAIEEGNEDEDFESFFAGMVSACVQDPFAVAANFIRIGYEIAKKESLEESLNVKED